MAFSFIAVAEVSSQTNPYRSQLSQKSIGQICKSNTNDLAVMSFITPQTEEVTPVWKPAYAVRTNWNGMEWKDYAKYTFTYDSKGRTLVEMAENLDKTQTQFYPFSLIEYTYDNLGRLCKSDVKAGFSPDELILVSTTETFYDEIRTDIVVEQNSYDIASDGTKSLNADSYKQIIERNEDNKIISMYAFTWYDGDFLEVQSLETEYGEDGNPTTITESVLTQNTESGLLEVKPNEVYTNCKWKSCNGQFITIDEITFGDNLLIQAIVNTAEQSDINMTVEYPGNEYDFISTSEYSYLTLIPTKSVMSYKDFGKKGFYSKTVTDQDLTSVGAYPVQSITQILHQYDDYGNLIQAQNQTFYGHTIINSWEKGTVENDPNNGFPAIYTHSTYHLQEDSDYYGSWEDDYKITYGNWVDVAGINDITITDSENAPIEYFNISGVRVDNPTSGIYIKKQGHSVQKIIVK